MVVKTRMCRFFAQGRCKYGQRCRFAHCVEELAGFSESAGESVLRQDVVDDFNATSSLEEHCTIASQDQTALEERHSATILPASLPSTLSEAADLDTHSSRGAETMEEDISESGYDSDSETDSTRASTMASVSTPRGGSEASSANGFATKKHGEPTTMLLKNVPECLTQGALVSLFEDLSYCMRGTFDFFYLPWNPIQCRNLGYAIINFFDSDHAAAFKREFNSQDLTRGSGNEKGLQIIPAILQGRIANIKHFSGFSLAHHANLRYRPLIRESPKDPLRAMYVAPELIVHY